jgi:putative ABC transport system permease protein
MKVSMYFKSTARSLIRGGQRTLLAIFCVAVGVMAIVALQLVGLMINGAFNSNVRDANGGDITIRTQNQSLNESDLAFLAQLKKEGTIQNYTPVINVQGYAGQVSLRQSFSVRVVDPAVYPIVTSPTFVNPTNGTITSLLKNKQVVVTQELIDQYKKKVGDTLDVRIGSQTSSIRQMHVKIVGIISSDGVLAQSGSLILLSVNDYKAATLQVTTPSQKTGTVPSGQESGTEPEQTDQSQSQMGTPPAQGQPSSSPAPDAHALLYDTINVNASAQKIASAVKKIQDQFPMADVQTAADVLKQRQDTIDNIRKFLEIAGLLALLIGGVGIVNTMQVLLSRRKTEIAMLKTAGYRRLDLYLLFGLEAGLLGLVGGLVGSAAATVVSYFVRDFVVQRLGLNIPFMLDWFTVGGGVIIGLVTALIFGLLPIVQAANIRPLNVIRDLPEGRGVGSVLLTICLLLVLSVLFCILAIVLLNNDVLLGIYSVYGAFVFLGILSLFFSLVILIVSKLPVPERLSFGYLALVLVAAALSALLWWVSPAFSGLLFVVSLMGIVVVLLPRTWKANVKMALRNLGRQRARTTTTMLALFVGIFAIGLILVLGQNLRDQINDVLAKTLNYNVFAITANDDTVKLHDKLKTLPGLTASQEHVMTSTAPISINGTPIGQLLPDEKSDEKAESGSLGRQGALFFLSGIEGFDVAHRQIPAVDNAPILQGRNLGPADAGTNNIVAPSLLSTLAPLHLRVDDKILVSDINRSMTRELTIVGFYQFNGFSRTTLQSLWGTKDTVAALSPADFKQSVFYLKIDNDKLSKVTDVIGKTVPDAFVLNLSSLTDFINTMLNNILLTLIVIASLSLLAGIIIIANAVALAMLERRRELGILKSVGYTSKSILSEVLFENGVIGGTGALLAMLLVMLVTSLLGMFFFKATFGVDTIVSLALILGSALLAMFVASLVAWGAVRVRPLEVLRYE